MDFSHEKDKIVLYNDKHMVVAEVTFPKTSENSVEVDHTFVDESLRGLGVASMLMQELVNELKQTHTKAKLTCSYAVSWFEKHPEYDDVVLPDTI